MYFGSLRLREGGLSYPDTDEKQGQRAGGVEGFSSRERVFFPEARAYGAQRT